MQSLRHARSPAGLTLLPSDQLPPSLPNLYKNQTLKILFQSVLKAEPERHCFELLEGFPTDFPTGSPGGFPVETRDMAGLAPDCPAVEDECEDPQQPDPPEVPDPPEPVCGDRKVEQPWEECDCGRDYRDCQVIRPETVQ